jgi:hypothetical protein
VCGVVCVCVSTSVFVIYIDIKAIRYTILLLLTHVSYF